ncbi:CaiB/BaiF CoA transferase family protein [Actinomadura scrupuli]|uniref:CaiB/BaiF CoA transferase family protein n=1 Tax=Actinomadura scrupuli TaxID=559629 RepID=UPI003D99910D
MTRAQPPLEGVRVIELGQLIAGPYCGQILADFGADVIKVEEPGVGDPMRQWGHLVQGKSLSWGVIARNKRCVTADLREEAGRCRVLELVRQADIVVENFRPGTLERYGLGYDQLAEVNAEIVLIRVSGYGQDGPYAHRPGYGSIGEAMGGLRYLMGEPDRPPSRTGVSIGDLLAGMHAALGGLLALRARDRTGVGQVVDVSIYESVLAMTEALVADYALAGVTRQRSGPVLPGVAPSNVYPTRDGDYVLIAANQDTVFRRLAAAMGDAELASAEEYATHQARGLRQAELDERIASWTARLTADELLRVLDEHAVPAGRVYTAREMLSDPHFRARNSIIEVEDADLGMVPMQGVTPKLSATPGAVRWPGAALGQHEAEVGELFGATTARPGGHAGPAGEAGPAVEGGEGGG